MLILPGLPACGDLLISPNLLTCLPCHLNSAWTSTPIRLGQIVEILRPRSLRLNEEAVKATVTNPASMIGSWLLGFRGLGLAALMAKISEAMRWFVFVAGRCRHACTAPRANPVRRTRASNVFSRN